MPLEASVFNLAHVQQERAHKALLARDLVDKAEKSESGPRPMTPEELGLFDKLQEEIANLDKQIEAIVAHEKRREASEELIRKLETPAGRETKPDQPANAVTVNGSATIRIPASARSTGTMKAFKGQDAEQRAYRAGMWVRGYLFHDPRAQHWCMNHGVGNLSDVRNALSTGSNVDGGFLVPDELSRAIIDLREEYGVYRRSVRVWPMGSDTLMIPRRSGGVTISALGENPSSAISQSNPTWGMVQLVAKKWGGLCLMSSEVAEDAIIDLADWVAREFAYGFAKAEDDAGFAGDGTSTYHGVRGLTNLLTTASALAGAVDATSGHDTFAEVDATDLATLMAKLPAYAARNAKFYCSRTAAELVFGRLQAVAGGNTVESLGNQVAARSYLGYPIVISQSLPTTTGTINDTAMLFFGDLELSSALGDRRQVRVFPSEHRYMDTDQIGIRGTERFDIVNHDVGDTTTAGPIVGLMGNT
jgi:HK97 family phage major capsid protein